MGPVEKELRSIPNHWSDQEIFWWLWGDLPEQYGNCSNETFSKVSETTVNFGVGSSRARMVPGFCITYCANRGLLLDLISEATEAAEALGL